MSKNMIVILHGVGSRGSDLQAVARHWQQSMPDTLIVLPDGPSAFDMGHGFQWFSVSGITEESRPARIAAARNAFDATLAAQFERHAVDPRRDRVILAGFSQGAIMAMDALVRGSCPLAGVVAFSGRLSSPEPLHPLAGSSALLVHGRADPVISWTESQKAAEALSAAGVQVKVSIEENAPHTITLSGMKTACSFIQKRFAPSV